MLSFSNMHLTTSVLHATVMPLAPGHPQAKSRSQPSSPLKPGPSFTTSHASAHTPPLAFSPLCLKCPGSKSPFPTFPACLSHPQAELVSSPCGFWKEGASRITPARCVLMACLSVSLWITCAQDGASLQAGMERSWWVRGRGAWSLGLFLLL